MKDLLILTGRSGRTWPLVLRAVKKYRRDDRRVLLYVPEQMTLQTERDLITGLELEGLLDIDVISPRKLRMLVREKAGGSDRNPLGEFGQIMAIHRAMTETKDDMQFYKNMTEMPGAVQRIREAVSELRESDITPEETMQYAGKASASAVQAKLTDLNRIRGAYEKLVSEHFDDEKISWTDTVRRLGQTDLLEKTVLMIYGFDTIRPDLRELVCAAAERAEKVLVILTADDRKAKDASIFEETNRSLDQLKAALNEES